MRAPSMLYIITHCDQFPPTAYSKAHPSQHDMSPSGGKCAIGKIANKINAGVALFQPYMISC